MSCKPPVQRRDDNTNRNFALGSLICDSRVQQRGWLQHVPFAESFHQSTFYPYQKPKKPHFPSHPIPSPTILHSPAWLRTIPSTLGTHAAWAPAKQLHARLPFLWIKVVDTPGLHHHHARILRRRPVDRAAAVGAEVARHERAALDGLG
jgi:hypothetical protein